MSSQALEQMLENTFVPNIAQNRMYQTIDTYTGGTTQLYSFDPPKPMDLPMGGIGPEPLKPLDRGYGDMSPNNSDVLGNRYELDNGYQLGERFDFSGHDDTEPHLNYDILKPNGSLLDTNKTKNILGENNHFKPLWEK